MSLGDLIIVNSVYRDGVVYIEKVKLRADLNTDVIL